MKQRLFSNEKHGIETAFIQIFNNQTIQKLNFYDSKIFASFFMPIDNMDIYTESGYKITIPKLFGEHYVFEKTVAPGSTCAMALATDKRTNEMVAVKIMSKSDSNASIKIEKEIQILTKINNKNQNIIKILDVIRFDDLVLIVMEYCQNGDLYEAITSGSLKTVAVKKRIMKGILNGISFLHKEFGIAHGDIKAENIVLDHNFEPKLIDFGNSKEYEIGDDNDKDGTLLYASPELLTEGRLFDTKKTDIYALGILMTTLFTGHFPYYSLSNDNVVEQILRHEFSYPRSMHPHLKLIMTKCTQFNPAKRPNIDEVLNYHWFNTASLVQIQNEPANLNLKYENNAHVSSTEVLVEQ